MVTSFANEDVFDSRGVQERIDELQEIEDNIISDNEELEDGDEPAEMDADEKEELDTLKAFKEEVDSSEWGYGLGFVQESYFEDYARETAEDIGAIDPKATWPNDCIDWEKAADELRMDYSAVELEGIIFYYRS